MSRHGLTRPRLPTWERATSLRHLRLTHYVAGMDAAIELELHAEELPLTAGPADLGDADRRDSQATPPASPAPPDETVAASQTAAPPAVVTSVCAVTQRPPRSEAASTLTPSTAATDSVTSAAPALPSATAVAATTTDSVALQNPPAAADKIRRLASRIFRPADTGFSLATRPRMQRPPGEEVPSQIQVHPGDQLSASSHHQYPTSVLVRPNVGGAIWRALADAKQRSDRHQWQLVQWLTFWTLDELLEDPSLLRRDRTLMPPPRAHPCRRCRWATIAQHDVSVRSHQQDENSDGIRIFCPACLSLRPTGSLRQTRPVVHRLQPGTLQSTVADSAHRRATAAPVMPGPRLCT